jgi:uncharacterized membrane protein
MFNTLITAEALQEVTVTLALLTDAVAVAIIAVAVLVALWRTAETVWKARRRAETAAAAQDEGPRLGLARALALGLEFLLAADIMRTAVAPTWTEIGQLAAIAALRTALNFFIQREIDGAERRRAG